ncbi:GNAT family N-acetyltransferase [Cytobacillus purgationiresistens]|uniref:Ribosomal protein S18 acetylase RimI-like enzyme n=1 Tax=Cytobacillus purgationiresistens TaxID=863449 RepID=A0ABU0AAX0_9BACI|nr:GNAT family N-acetyltransferase [Cytobacillus purgationiresistens]MDQ0268403.1 ribosomal protein S18 acetylase RimI-like enzyme [Cytobacillus purgationiresistens]
MNERLASEILTWKYEPPYDFYNNKLNEESVQEMVSNHYYAAFNGEELLGFFCYGQSAQVPAGNEYSAYDLDCIDIGLGMKPTQTGKGMGSEFLSYILNDAEQAHLNKSHRLTVANFNVRAIRLYRKFGFVSKVEFSNDKCTFLVMERE